MGFKGAKQSRSEQQDEPPTCGGTLQFLVDALAVVHPIDALAVVHPIAKALWQGLPAYQCWGQYTSWTVKSTEGKAGLQERGFLLTLQSVGGDATRKLVGR